MRVFTGSKLENLFVCGYNLRNLPSQGCSYGLNCVGSNQDPIMGDAKYLEKKCTWGLSKLAQSFKYNFGYMKETVDKRLLKHDSGRQHHVLTTCVLAVDCTACG